MSRKTVIREFTDLRKAEEIYPLHSTSSEADIIKYYHSLPAVKEFYNKTYKLSYEGKQYFINPAKPECTCSEFKENAEKYSSSDIRIICRHIYVKYKQLKILNSFDSLTRILLSSTVLFGEKELFRNSGDEFLFVMGGSNSGGWQNIYAKNESGEFTRYSYNKTQNRWSYNIAPPLEKIIITKI